MPKLRVILEMELTNDAGIPLNQAQLQDIADLTEDTIRNRLFGAGFLPDEVIADRYTTQSEIIA